MNNSSKDEFRLRCAIYLICLAGAAGKIFYDADQPRLTTVALAFALGAGMVMFRSFVRSNRVAQ